MSDQDIELDELPENWSWATLEAVTSVEPNAMTDGPFGSKLKSSDYVSSGVRVVRLGNVGIGRFINRDQSFVSDLKYEDLKKHEIFEGDLVVAALAEPVGRCAQIPASLGKAVVKADCVRLKVHGEIESKYVMNCLNSPQGQRRAQDTGHGIGRLRINMGEMRALALPLAPASEQRRIVAKLEALTEKSRRAKEALDAIPPLLERFRQSVLASAFRGDLTAAWRAKNPDAEPAEKLLQRIRTERRRRWEEAELTKMQAKGKTPGDDRWKQKYEEPEPVNMEGLPDLPEGWCWASVEEIIRAEFPLCYGVVQPGEESEGGVLLIRVCDLADGKITMSGLRTIAPDVDQEYARSRLRGGELLVSVVGTIGRVAIASPMVAGANIARAVARISPCEEVGPNWLATWFSSEFMQDRLSREAREVARKTLNLDTLRGFPVLLAPQSEMNVIAQKVSDYMDKASKIAALCAEGAAANSSLDRSILAKAFRGDLVPQDPADEPASVLLDRIRAERAAAALAKDTKKPPKRPR